MTVASNNDIDIGGNISYVTPGQDVLGIVAENNVVVAQYAPSHHDLDGRGAGRDGNLGVVQPTTAATPR